MKLVIELYPMLFSPENALALRCCSSSPLGNDRVAIQRNGSEAIAALTRARPNYFEPIKLGGGAEADDLAQVMGREITAAAIFQTGSRDSVDRPGEPRTDGVAVARFAD